MAVDVRQNLCINPSFQVDTTGWTTDGSHIASSEEEFHDGTRSLLIDSSVEGGGATCDLAVTAGQTYTVSAWFMSPVAREVQIYISGSGDSGAIPVEAGEWTRVSTTVTLGWSGNTIIYFYSPDAPGIFYLDSVLVEVSPTLGSYFDGDIPDTPWRQYAWLGAANASISTLTSTPPALIPSDPKDPLYRGYRREYYRVDLMSNRDGTIGQLDGVSQISLTYDGDTAGVLTSAGSLSLIDQDQNIDWLNARCQPWAEVNGISWPLGVYIMSAPTEQHESTGRSWSVALKDKLSILDEDLMAETYALNTGDNVVDAIRNLIAGAGEANHAISADVRNLSGPLTWPPATSRLAIIQDLLKMLNFAPLWVDGWGQYVGEPFVDPQHRPVDGYFEEGTTAIHLPSFQVTKDVASIPNRLIAVSSTSAAGLTIIADNNEPTNPYSIPARGRVIARQEDFDAADLTALAALAVRRMQELMAPGSEVQFQHAVIPLQVGSVVRFTSDGIDLDGVVMSTSVSLAAGEMMQTVIQEVVRASLTVS